MKRRWSTLACVCALAQVGCWESGRRGAIDASRFVAKSDWRIEQELGGAPTPGPNAHTGIRDRAGRLVVLPTERVSFAVEVVAYEVGGPAPVPEGQHAAEALGPPDYSADTRRLPRSVSLGNGGFITLRFVEGALTDGEGPDLFVFEIGPSVEGMEVQISPDGKAWTSVGEVQGGACAIDIGPFVAAEDVFSHVRIRDIPHQGAESDFWPGADLDAVGVVHADQRASLPSELLFALDSDALEPGASAALDRWVTSIARRPGTHVTIEGHTDDLGTEAYNQALSARRAEAVAIYLVQRGVARERLTVRGFGESRPVTIAEGDENRRKNRRVELLIHDP